MKLQEIPIEELELLSYADITYKIIKETKKTMITPLLFKEVCSLLEYGESEFDSKIGDYYTSLTMDKRFVLLKNNEWDIRDHHSVQIILDEDEESDEDEIEEEVEEEEEEEDEDVIDEDVIDDDVVEDDMEDLTIIDEDELEE